MRIIGYILLVVGLFYTFILYAKSKVNFDVSLEDLDLGGLAISAIEGDPKLRTFLNIKIKNDNAFTISFSSLDVKLFYQGSQIAKSVDVSKDKIVILPKMEQDFIHKLDLKVTKPFFDAFKTIVVGQPLVLQYQISMRLFGLPIPTYKSNFTYIK